MTELSFLIELLLNHDLPKETKTLIAQRIKDVESGLVLKPQNNRASDQMLAPKPMAAPVLSEAESAARQKSFEAAKLARQNNHQ